MLVQRKIDGAKFYAHIDEVGTVVINGKKYSDVMFARYFRIINVY